MGTCSHMIPYTHVVSVHIRGQGIMFISDIVYVHECETLHLEILG